VHGERDLRVEPRRQTGAEPRERHRQRHLALERALDRYQGLVAAALPPHAEGQGGAQHAAAQEHRDGHQAFQHVRAEAGTLQRGNHEW
jgi:hypothetical protein